MSDTAKQCIHPRLVKVLNFGGEASTTYKCKQCNKLLTVSIAPLKPISVSYGTETKP